MDRYDLCMQWMKVSVQVFDPFARRGAKLAKTIELNSHVRLLGTSCIASKSYTSVCAWHILGLKIVNSWGHYACVHFLSSHDQHCKGTIASMLLPDCTACKAYRACQICPGLARQQKAAVQDLRGR